MALIDKETICAEIEARREHMVYELYGLEENTPKYQRVKGMHDAYVDMLTYLTYSLPEQPVEGLDKARFLEILYQWEAHAIRGMRDGATAYHQGKIALITDLRDWINREG